MSETVITGVPVEQFGAVWPHVRTYFDGFVERSEGEVSVHDLLEGIASKDRQVWIAIEDKEVLACALTQVQDNPKGTVVIDFCSGKDRDKWRDKLVETIEQWAASLGSERVRIICRPGWTRELKNYRETHRVVERDIA